MDKYTTISTVGNRNIEKGESKIYSRRKKSMTVQAHPFETQAHYSKESPPLATNRFN